MRLFASHSLRRSPLSPSVPLDGTETVRGLLALEKHHLLEGFTDQTPQPRTREQLVRTGRRHYQRYKGPYIEDVAVDDLKRTPRPWNAFLGDGSAAYTIPCDMSVLQERLEENLVYYLPNYLRVALAILLLVMYLRPVALLGTAAVVANVFVHTRRTLRRQLRQQQQQRAGVPQRGLSDAEAQDTPLAILSTLATWLVVAYTRCFSLIVLAAALSTLAILLHASGRKAPSESRHRGKNSLGYRLEQLVGLAPVKEGQDPYLVFRQQWWLLKSWGKGLGRQLWRRVQYYAYLARSSFRHRRFA